VKVNNALNNKTSPGNTHVNNKQGTDHSLVRIQLSEIAKLMMQVNPVK